MKILNSKYLLLLFPIIVFLYFYYYLNFDGLYGQDAYEYLRYSKALQNFVITGENPGDYFWPLFYPIFGALFGFITQNIALSLLLISVVSLGLSAFYLHKILDLLFPNSKHTVIYIVTFFLLSPSIFKSGMLVMSDMLALFFIVLTVYQFLKFKQNLKIKHIYFIAIFSFSAFMTRYASAIILLPFIITVLVLFFKQKKNHLHLLFLFVLIGLLFLPHFLIRYHNTTNFLSHEWLQNWSFANLFKSNFTTVDGISNNSLPNIMYSFTNLFHPKFIFIGGLFIPFLFFRKSNFNNSKIILIGVLLYAIFLGGIPFQNTRFLVLSFPLILLLFYPIFIFLQELKWLKKIFYFGIICSIILQLFLIRKSFHSIIKRNKLEIEVSKIMQPYQNNKLYSFDIDIALQGRNLDFDYKNLWQKQYDDLQIGDLVLFHPTKFIVQWQGKNPMLNFNYFIDNYKLKVIEELPEGWKLYKVEAK